MKKNYIEIMRPYEACQPKGLLNDAVELDPVEERRKRQRRYYTDMSAEKKSRIT